MDIDLVSLIEKLGAPLALLAYFAYKDWKFTGRVVELMAKVETLMNQLAANPARKDDAA